jgi:hypothetical protein
MDRHTSVRRFPGVVAAAVCALSWAAGAGASAQSSTPDVRVAVFAEYYVLADRAIDDLDRLDEAVRAMRPRSVGLDACGAGSERAQRAAAHRFRQLSLELRVVEPGAPQCRSSTLPRAVPVSQRSGPRPYGIDDAAVDRWWHQLMP